jgi:hypothetical protein
MAHSYMLQVSGIALHVASTRDYIGKLFLKILGPVDYFLSAAAVNKYGL